ncbi:MAG: hypothetical protein ACLQRH_26695 [Acidimicrobiales bacterium]
MSFVSPVLSFDNEEAATEGYFELGFTDGLPVIAPTEERVTAMLAMARLEPGEVLGEVPTRNVKVAAEKVAINAVMAGCRPEYFPVVVAAVRAFLQPKANAHSTTATLAGAAHAVIVNGPARTELDIVSGQACFGPGFRANATIGRALRLVIRNVCRTVPGDLDRASFSWPLRYSFCFGENEEASEWTPLHVQFGYARDDSVVTIQSITSLVGLFEFDPSPESILRTFSHFARAYGMGRDDFVGDARSLVYVMGPEHQRRFVDEGWTKEGVSEALWTLLTAPAAGPYDRHVDVTGPENVLLVAAGGPGIAQSWLLLPHLAAPTHERVGR